MSVIFGIINKEGVPVEKHIHGQLYSSIEYFPHNNYTLFNENNIGLGWVQLFDTPESVYDKQPFTFCNNRYILLGKARLDNRDDLLNIFSIPVEERSTYPDTKLLSNAFEKWGKSCPKNLFGDWAFAVWDKHEKELFIARDHYGITGLFYLLTDKYFAFSTSIHSLESLLENKKDINQIQLGHILAAWNGDPENTIYTSVKKIPPSYAGTYNLKEFNLFKYWDIRNIPRIYFKKDSDYIDKLDEIFSKAIKQRLRSVGKVGTTLSSGLDSGTVTAYSAIESLSERKQITAYTHVPLFNPQNLNESKIYGDEGPFASQIAELYSNIEHKLIRSENRNPLSGIIDSIKIHKSPVRNVTNQYWLISLIESVKNDGIKTLLTGQNGNITFSWPFPGYNKKIEQTGLKSFTRKRIPYPILKYWHRIKKGKEPYLKYSVINPSFSKEIELYKTMIEKEYDPYFIGESSLNNARIKALNISLINNGCLWQEIGDYFGVNIYDPTSDLKLIEFCFGIPDNQFINKDYDRYLIRRLVKNKLPENIINNKLKAKQGADISVRIKQTINQFQEILNKMEQSDQCCMILNIKLLQSYLDLYKSSDQNISSKIETSIMRGFSVGLFLLQLEETAFYKEKVHF